jgi:hypothetical protein
MRGVTPPLSHTSSWRGTQLSTGTISTYGGTDQRVTRKKKKQKIVADKQPPFNAEVTNAWSNTFIPQYAFMW